MIIITEQESYVNEEKELVHIYEINGNIFKVTNMFSKKGPTVMEGVVKVLLDKLEEKKKEETS